MNPFRTLADLALELRKEVLHRYATDDPYTQEEAISVDSRLKTLAADCRVAARRMGCAGGEQAIDTLFQATVDLFNAPAQLRDPYSRANHLTATLPPISKLADDWEAELRRDRPTTETAGTPAGGGDGPSMSLRRVGKAWRLRYQGETADFSVGDNQFLGWLAKLLSKPNHPWTVAELLGDPDGKLKADASLGGEWAKDKKTLRAIYERIEDINAITEETGGTEALEQEKQQLLREVEGHSATERMEAGVGKVYNNITTQKRQFLKKLAKDMPQLTALLKACIIPSGGDYTLSYRPPAGTPGWHIENPPA
jgi:hypothetical protein